MNDPLELFVYSVWEFPHERMAAIEEELSQWGSVMRDGEEYAVMEDGTLKISVTDPFDESIVTEFLRDNGFYVGRVRRPE